MKRLTKNLLLPATTVLLAATGAADDISIGSSYHKNYGGGVGGGYVAADAGVTLSNETYFLNQVEHHDYSISAGAHASAGVTVLWNNIQAFYVGADAFLGDDTGSTSSALNASITGALRIGPWTLASYDSELDLSASHSFGPYSLFGGGLSAFWWIGPVPLHVGADAGAGAGANFVLHLDPFEHSATATPSANAYAYGSLWAGFAFWPFSAGIIANMTLANTTLQYDLVGDLEDGVSGTLTLSTNPIAIYLKLYASVNLWFWHQTWYWTIYSWSAGTVHFSTPLL